MEREAFERARSAYGTGAYDDATLEFVFPQLKESEDERIRNGLIEVVSDIAGGWPFEEHRITKKEALAYLEKQKESVVDKEGMYYYLGGKFIYCGYPALEENPYDFAMSQQKENPKSADSIPSECTSDAKCEDRWHKVGDSLPDNPREVLCKDEAGNYFIGRYYVGEGWEISNYDDEDKPHHLNPPVSKWIDFPSERQKEQKPINQCNTHEPTLDEARKWNEAYEKGYSLGYKNGRNEQKPADDKAFEEWIDDWWKHNKVNNPDSYDKGDEIQFDERGFKNFCRGIRNMYQQKPAEWSEEDEAFLKVAIAVCNRYSHKDIADWLKSLRPQPKAELSEDVKKTLDEVSHILVGLNYKQIAKDYKQAIEKLLYSRPSWKPSEKDIKMLEHIIGQYETGNKNGKVMGYLPRVEELSFLKKVLSKWKN